MKIVIVSRNPSLYSTRRLGLVGLARGHDVRVVSPLRCSFAVRAGGADVFVSAEPVGAVDAVISRISPSASAHSLAVLRQFELGGAYCLNRSEPTARGRDKLRTLQLLASRGIGVAPTGLAHHPDDVRDVVERLGGPPVIVKLVDGTQGAGVALAESVTAAQSIVEALQAAHRNVLVQAFVPHDSDARLFVVGGQVVAAMRRYARFGNFRANLHQGGVAEALKPSDAQRDAAVAAAVGLGLEMAGVDLLDGPSGPVILEVNASPGLEGIEAASGRNVAGSIVRFLEARVRENEPAR